MCLVGLILPGKPLRGGLHRVLSFHFFFFLFSNLITILVDVAESVVIHMLILGWIWLYEIMIFKNKIISILLIFLNTY